MSNLLPISCTGDSRTTVCCNYCWLQGRVLLQGCSLRPCCGGRCCLRCFPLRQRPKDSVTSLALMSWILNDCRLYPPVLLEVSQHLINVDGWISLRFGDEKTTFSPPCSREQLHGGASGARSWSWRAYVCFCLQAISSITLPRVLSPAS